jgi:adenylate kinase family enzyme
MKIILVGPDGSGKTYLANKISDEFNIPIIKKTYPKTDEEKKNMFNDYMNINDDNEIYDRYAYCELAYGSCVRNNSVISFKQLQRLENKLKHNSLVIHCTDTIDNLWERCQQRGEDYIKEKSMLLSIKMYYDLLFSSKRKVEVINYSIQNAINNYKDIKS